MENELWGIPIEDLAGGWWFNHVFLQSGWNHQSASVIVYQLQLYNIQLKPSDIDISFQTRLYPKITAILVTWDIPTFLRLNIVAPMGLAWCPNWLVKRPSLPQQPVGIGTFFSYGNQQDNGGSNT